jgi:hypothetical protein
MTMTPPSPNGDNGRTTGGRFAAGNPGGPGNPYAKRIGELRSALLQAVTDEDWTAMIRKLIDEAKAGERWAIGELLTRVLGKPTEADLIERLEALEAALTAREGNKP